MKGAPKRGIGKTVKSFCQGVFMIGVILKGRRDVDREILAQVANENDDRLILVHAMANAVVAINGVEPTERLITGQLQATRRAFTTVRRRLSPTGTWIELPDGQWVRSACAQEAHRPSLPPDPEQALLDELRHMPEASEAMQSRREREKLILGWKKADLIGEANDGRVVFLKGRRDVDREILAQVANENDDRLILVHAMANAVVAINGVEPTERLITGQLQATRRAFTTVRRRLSPTGTWIELPDGQWVRK